MKTGYGGRIRYRTTTALTLAAALALPLVLSGCEDHSPVAAPTSTLPAKDSSTATPAADPQPTIPAYETELDLSPEETEAVEGALVAFEGYIATINRVFSSGGKDNKDTEIFASEKSLEALETSADELENSGQYMAGKYDYYDVRIHDVALEPDANRADSVIVLYCSHDSNHAVVDLEDPLPSQKPQSLTMKHTITKQEDDTWKVSNQELWSKKCE
ncbi:hypothetical protein BAURA86_01547 [Brevibacterium aurantiacum]|uniref:Lipoprotein n=1 Tax=Brevibacterium aurantiacum TaxID=273384 RepID=A0A2H1JCN8_BREAU|nr:hypothetical protein [Brevibacterium aurantiacum]SMX85183.1 hypothetical protein BAURA86_01547 [Brevibacterium aurantiacum]